MEKEIYTHVSPYNARNSFNEGKNECRKETPRGEKCTDYCLNIISTFGALFFFVCVCCASLLKPDSKAKLYQESDFQQNVEASKNWQNVTATLLSQQTPHAQDLVYSTPTASSRI